MNPNTFKNRDVRLAALLAVYAFFEEMTAELGPRACKPGCAACCGRSVQLTQLEGILLIDGLVAAGRGDVVRAAAGSSPERSRPRVTTNQLAAMCLAHQEPPVEDAHCDDGPCALLADGLCLAYEQRPLACRTMASSETCRPGGGAVADPWLVTLSTMLFQVVEHLAVGGGFGLLADVMAAADGGDPMALLPCRSLPGLPAPPQHAERLGEVVRGLMTRTVQGRPLGLWLQDWAEEAA